MARQLARDDACASGVVSGAAAAHELLCPWIAGAAWA